MPRCFQQRPLKALIRLLIFCVFRGSFSQTRALWEVTAKWECLFRAVGCRWTTRFPAKHISPCHRWTRRYLQESQRHPVHYREGHSCSRGAKAGTSQDWMHMLILSKISSTSVSRKRISLVTCCRPQLRFGDGSTGRGGAGQQLVEGPPLVLLFPYVVPPPPSPTYLEQVPGIVGSAFIF